MEYDINFSMTPISSSWTKSLPKVELHAHLSGSISRQTLHEIWKSKSTTLQNPLTAIPVGKVDYDLKTFFPLFSSYIYALVNDRHSIEYSTNCVLRDFADDGVIYLELRTTPRDVKTAEGALVMTASQYVMTVLDCLRGQNSASGSTMQVRLILSIDRRMAADEAHRVVDLALYNRGTGVVGVDICGDPSMGDISVFSPAIAKAKRAGMGVTVHFAEAAESAGLDELRTILDWNPGRLGHVIHEPEAMRDEILRRGIAVELCLSCNVHAKMITGSYKDHHFEYWWKQKARIALSTDDVGIFCSPLSEEYRLVGEHFGLTEDDMIELNKGAIEASFLGGAEKEKLRKIIKAFESGTEVVWAEDEIDRT